MEVSRRKFLTGATGTLGLSLFGGFTLKKKWFKEVNAASNATSPEEKILYLAHHPHCGNRHHMKVTARNGKLVKIQPHTLKNGEKPKLCTGLCLRAGSEIERVYSPDRLKTPMRRVGERGEGKFEPISWDEAIDTIASKFQEIKDEYGGQSILYKSSVSPQYKYPFLTGYFNMQSGNPGGIDIGIANGLWKVIGQSFYGSGQNDVTDLENSKVIILWGKNTLETTLSVTAPYIMDAKKNGTKVILIDPNHTPTATKVDQWIPIQPGTDSALVWALIHVILKNNWFNDEYVRKYTTLPNLVRSDNRELLRESDIIAGGDEQKFVVWNQVTNSAQVDGDQVIASLEGNFEVNGIKVNTVFSLLKDMSNQYTPEKVSEIVDIKPEVINELAKDYATRGPAALVLGFGMDRWYHADTTGRLLAFLAGLTGNIGTVGGGVGISQPTWSGRLGSWPIPQEFATTKGGKLLAELRESDEIKAIFVQGNPLQQSYPDIEKTIEWVKKLDFVVTVDIFNNFSAQCADIILPASSNFENESETGHLRIEQGYVMLDDKVIDPLFESKTDFQIEQEFAKKIGYSHLLPKDMKEYAKTLLATSNDPALKGITYDELRKNENILRLNVPNEPYRLFTDKKFPTKSGKLEFYQEEYLPEKLELPEYEEPFEASPNNALFAKYPLIYGTYHSRFTAHSEFTNARWLQQIRPEPLVLMNPKDADKRGFKNGDYVRVFNDRGSFTARYQSANDMRPGMICMNHGWWPKAYKEGSFQSVTHSLVNPRQWKTTFGPVYGLYDVLVDVQKA
ncbi:molybdopterin-dependent oxidoreductase [Bacillaceae bacterium S4-13-58]